MHFKKSFILISFSKQIVGVCHLPVDVSCNFESTYCSWSSVSVLSHTAGTLNADLLWTVQNGQRTGGPSSDHSSTDGSELMVDDTFVCEARLKR